MPLHSICSYKDQAQNGAGTKNGETITGHHIIPDHCFYYTSGLRGKGDLSSFLIPGIGGYTTNDAPVILLTAESNGGKSLQHGMVHAVFDPIESKAARINGNQWTYGEARAAAVKSICDTLKHIEPSKIVQALDAYFKDKCKLNDDTLIRAGEHGTMKTAPEPRKSSRKRKLEDI